MAGTEERTQRSPRTAANPRRDRTRTFGRSGPLLLVAAAAALAACSTPVSPRVASLGKIAGSTDGPATGDSGGHSASPAPKDSSPTALVDEWAACERSHGDPDQTDPVIDSHGGIDITTPGLGQARPVGNPHGAAGMCSQYLVRAQAELRAEFPVRDPQGPSEATYLKYVDCMRANGVPNYPSPSGPGDSQTNFNGTGVNPNSPQVVRVNNLCGKRLGLPAWWINGWGPPGNISVGPPAGGPPKSTPVPAGNGASGSYG